jgi:hypothetical protein
MSARSKGMMKEQKWWQERWCRVGSASKMPPSDENFDARYGRW